MERSSGTWLQEYSTMPRVLEILSNILHPIEYSYGSTEVSKIYPTFSIAYLIYSTSHLSTINHRYFCWLRFAGTTNQRYDYYCPIYTATRSVSHQGACPSRKTRSPNNYRNYVTDRPIRCGIASGVDQSKSDSPEISASGPHIGFGRHQRSTAVVLQVFVFRIVYVLPSGLSVTTTITRLV